MVSVSYTNNIIVFRNLEEGFLYYFFKGKSNQLNVIQGNVFKIYDKDFTGKLISQVPELEFKQIKTTDGIRTFVFSTSRNVVSIGSGNGAKGATGATGAIGATGATGASGTQAISLNEEAEGSVLGVTEQVIDEFNVDFTNLPANITVNFSGLIRVSGGTGTFNLQVGGTIATADGTTRATLSTTSITYDQENNTGASFANPGGQQLVKITGDNTSASEISFIRGYNVKIG